MSGVDGNDDRAPDFSAVRANARLELHEAVCAERLKSIMAGMGQLSVQMAAVHDRLNTVSSRMWLAVTGVCAASVVGLAAVVFHLLTRGAK